jgi:hypothetical protein
MEVDAPAPSASKRPAPSEPSLDPPDKKSKVKELLPHTSKGTAEDKGTGPTSGILQQLASGLAGPIPIQPPTYIVCDSEGLAPFFRSIRLQLLYVLYPDGRWGINNVITEENFVIVCRYLMVARLHAVYSSVSGRRIDGRIAVPKAFQLPKCLADVLNGFGLINVANNGLMLCPQPEAQAVDPGQRLTALCNHVIMTQFERLVLSVFHRGFIRVGYLSSVPEGTAWWMVSIRSATNMANVIIEDTDAVQPVAVFSEFTPSDGLMAAIVQRGNNGLLDGVILEPLWIMPQISGAMAIRAEYVLQA